MAFTYKTIGNTAAAVASLFAVGTLLWWQRSPTPIDAPRPQDEAEIMTAILERHAAMGRTNAAFVRVIPAVTNMVAVTNGAPGAVPNMIETGWVWDESIGEIVMGFATNGWVRIVTNAPAVSLTNTIGFMPNAPDRYSTEARSAFVPKGVDGLPGALAWDAAWKDGTGMNFEQRTVADWWAWQGKKVLVGSDWFSDGFRAWIIPDNSYMDSGSISWFDRDTSYTSASNMFLQPLSFEQPITDDLSWVGTYCEGARQAWTNYVTKPLATWTTSTNYPIYRTITNISGAVTNFSTQTVYVVTNYVNTREYDTFAHYTYGGDDNGYLPTISAMQFAYERDTPGWRKRFDRNRYYGGPDAYAKTHKPQFWSTNKYNDIGRALSLLQWIRQPKSASTSSYWFVEYKYATSNNPSGSQVSYTETNTVSSGVTHPSVGRSYAKSGTNFVNRAWGTMVSYDFPNPVPFAVDTVQWQLTAASTNGFVPDSSRPATIAGPVAAGGSASSGWWPRNPTTLRAELETFVKNTPYNSASNIAFSATLQECYHVQFSALTNYANHAPPR